MKRMIAIILLAMMCVIFSACSNRTPVETSEELVYAEIIDEYYRGAWLQPIPTGKSIMMLPHPAKYSITVKYGEFEEEFTDSTFYEENHDRIGETVAIKLVYIKYDDGSEKTYLALLSDDSIE